MLLISNRFCPDWDFYKKRNNDCNISGNSYFSRNQWNGTLNCSDPIKLHQTIVGDVIYLVGFYCRNQRNNLVAQHLSIRITNNFKLNAFIMTSHFIIKPMQRNSVQGHVNSTSSVLRRKEGPPRPLTLLLKCNFQNTFAFLVLTIHTIYWNCLLKLETFWTIPWCIHYPDFWPHENLNDKIRALCEKSDGKLLQSEAIQSNQSGSVLSL